MERYFSIFSFISIMFMTILLMVDFDIISTRNADFDALVLQKQVNYASDASVDALLASADLEADYGTDTIAVTPDLGVLEFTTIMANAMGYSVSDEILEQIQREYFQTLLVCAHDGIYAYTNRVSDSDGSKEFIASPKLPYYYTKYEGTDRQEQYLLNLGMKKGYRDIYDSATGRYTISVYKELNLSQDEQITAINNQVSEVLQYELLQNAGLDTGTTYTIPAFASEINGAQPVQNITVLAVLNTGDSRTNAVLGIGGSYIESDDAIIGFLNNNIRYYAHQSKLSAKGLNVTPTATFDSVYSAASSGYNCALWLYE